MNVFSAAQAKVVTDFVLSTYFKHFKLYKYVFTPMVCGGRVAGTGRRGGGELLEHEPLVAFLPQLDKLHSLALPGIFVRQRVVRKPMWRRRNGRWCRERVLPPVGTTHAPNGGRRPSLGRGPERTIRWHNRLRCAAGSLN